MHQEPLPALFCWTRFGTEAGEPISSILNRKEMERRANDGVFYWGIGNSVAPGITSLLERVKTPEVLFSPIKSRPRPVDMAPETVVRWREATTIAGDPITIPKTVRITSRPSRAHYALVCAATEPLELGHLGRLNFSELRNLVSGHQLGASQVTAVVSRELEAGDRSRDGYLVALRALLVEPYFVRLAAPGVETRTEIERRAA